jgi:hypothetical protein
VRESPFTSHGEQDPDGHVERGDDEPEAGEHDDELNGPLRRGRPVLAGEVAQRVPLPDKDGDAAPSDAEHLGQDHDQIEEARHDNDADGACGDRSAGVSGFLAECRRRLEAGKCGDAEDHRIGDVSELAVRRRPRCEDCGGVVGWPDLDQNRDGQGGDDGYFPGDQDQVDPGRGPDAQVGDQGHRGQDDDEQHPSRDGHMQGVGHQIRRVCACQCDTGGDVERVGEDHHPAGEETSGVAQPTAVVGVQRAGRRQPASELRDAAGTAQRRYKRDEHDQRRGEPGVSHDDDQPGHDRTSGSHVAGPERDHPGRPNCPMSQSVCLITIPAAEPPPTPGEAGHWPAHRLPRRSRARSDAPRGTGRRPGPFVLDESRATVLCPIRQVVLTECRAVCQCRRRFPARREAGRRQSMQRRSGRGRRRWPRRSSGRSAAG